MNLPLRPPNNQPTVESREPDRSVCVVICTRNRPASLRRCLAAVSRLDQPPEQILVVDNSEGTNDTFEIAREYGTRYTIEPVRGLSRARNRGLTECDTDFIAFLDDDVVPAPDWLGHLLEPFSVGRIGATAGRVITPDSQINDELEKSPRTLNNQVPHWFEIATFGGLGLGANMAFRKRTLPIQQLFDERLGRGAPLEIGEESYAFARLLEQGSHIAYVPTAIVYHPPLSRGSIQHEARNSFAYWLLLFAEFPGQRMNIFHFLVRRLRGQPLDWPRHPQEPGDIVSSSVPILLLAAIKGLWLFIHTPKHRRFGNN
ncbi:glycosyltransferase family A protein [Telmatobacter sp. DSM 110680]|uniref:Glycosyltransferase family A protein n=1 Tax=Telmatobacter sp. DSM 110680 TaxID=3036704 RepID=A0AAU7DEC6_9BACT